MVPGLAGLGQDLCGSHGVVDLCRRLAVLGQHPEHMVLVVLVPGERTDPRRNLG